MNNKELEDFGQRVYESIEDIIPTDGLCSNWFYKEVGERVNIILTELGIK